MGGYRRHWRKGSLCPRRAGPKRAGKHQFRQVVRLGVRVRVRVWGGHSCSMNQSQNTEPVLHDVTGPAVDLFRQFDPVSGATLW